ncbi:MAG: flagellar motor protein MotB [Clostridia bacterium]
MKRKKFDPPEGAADWVVSYGDIMSLLLTFFIMLFASSTIDAVKWQQIVESMRGMAGINTHSEQREFSPIKKEVTSSKDKSNIIRSIVESGDSIPLVNSGTETPEQDNENDSPKDDGYSVEEAFGDLYGDLIKVINAEGNKWDMDVIQTESSIILRFTNKILFDSGYADLDEDALDVLIVILGVISQYEDYLDKLVIEGNTDDIPINTTRYRDNFELSIYRALNVFYFIQREGLFPANKIEIKGYGENNPIASNDTEEGRALNRRTDIVIEKAEEDE